MSAIFLSYAHQDKEFAQRLANALAQNGSEIWWDQRLAPGQRFADVIAERLAKASCIVVLWSKYSVISDWVIDESSEGKRRGVLVPATIDGVDPPIGFRQIHAANLVDWDGNASDTKLAGIIDAINSLISRDSVVTSEIPLTPTSASTPDSTPPPVLPSASFWEQFATRRKFFAVGFLLIFAVTTTFLIARRSSAPSDEKIKVSGTPEPTTSGMPLPKAPMPDQTSIAIPEIDQTSTSSPKRELAHINPHKIEELFASELAARQGIDNTPSGKVQSNLKLLLAKIIEPTEQHFNRRADILSGYRSSVLNALVMGMWENPRSAHLSGEAVAFSFPDIPARVVACWIRENLEYDKLALKDTFVDVSIENHEKTGNRRIVLGEFAKESCKDHQ